ncbi:hypothetical protein PR202_gb08182 [Eleusine coracana subsp. coracana]|uniref:Uncharacterized protein n=1 Tax=Eleusine coracana subsp. coracana TaxID=191504 RepID=A0AAV5EDM6_ELECO|nr:hypothetical protein PR202_gb08182 [Eleusine coracana subsp. coracana]
MVRLRTTMICPPRRIGRRADPEHLTVDEWKVSYHWRRISSVMPVERLLTRPMTRAFASVAGRRDVRLLAQAWRAVASLVREAVAGLGTGSSC